MATEHPSAQAPKYPLRWNEYISLIYDLGIQIKKSKQKYRYIYGIPRGGLIPATILAHQLGIELIVKDFSHCFVEGNVLIVDDLADTGKTLEPYTQFDIATIYWKKWSTVKPTYFLKETDKWIVFPYEKN